MPRPVRTKPVSGPQVRAYAAKAQEYAEAATNEVDAGRFIAATSLSIHAGINAADAARSALRHGRPSGSCHRFVTPEIRHSGAL